MLAWGVTVALKFAWAIPLNSRIYNALNGALPAVVAQPLFDLYVGALTGVFEVAVTYAVLRRTRFGRAPWAQAFAFGIGFGAIETLLLSLTPLLSVVAALVSPGVFPLTALESLAQLNDPVYSLAPVVERFFTVWVHIFSNVLIFYAIAKREPRWFWLAFMFKTLIDTVAAFAQVSGMLSGTGTSALVNLWLIEAIVVVWGLCGWWARNGSSGNIRARRKPHVWNKSSRPLHRCREQAGVLSANNVKFQFHFSFSVLYSIHTE